MFKGFRDFLVRGNLIELAIAFIMGAVFAAVVKAFTDLVLDLIGLLLPIDGAFSTATIAGINIGPFLSAVITFVLTAFVVYFFIVKPYEAARRVLGHKPEEEVESEADLLKQIRDLLAEKERPQV